MCTHVYTVCIHPKLISLSCLIESTGTVYINNIILISCIFTVCTCTCRNENKRNKMKKHEKEKEYMTSLQVQVDVMTTALNQNSVIAVTVFQSQTAVTVCQ